MTALVWVVYAPKSFVFFGQYDSLRDKHETVERMENAKIFNDRKKAHSALMRYGHSAWEVREVKLVMGSRSS